jgi:flagellin
MNKFNIAACIMVKSLGWFAPSSKRVNRRDASSNLAAPIGQPTADNGALSSAQLFLRTQDAYLQQVGGALDQMSLLAVESQDVTKTDDERAAFQQEFATLAGYITDIAAKGFNDVRLFSGALLIVTIAGYNSTCKIPGINLALAAYTGATAACIATPAGATAAVQAVTAAIAQLDTDRASIGASEKQLLHVNGQRAARDEELAVANN